MKLILASDNPEEKRQKVIKGAIGQGLKQVRQFQIDDISLNKPSKSVQYSFALQCALDQIPFLIILTEYNKKNNKQK